MDEKLGVYWHQGMFMQPQHFQIADLHGPFRIKPFLESTVPHFWGVGELEIAATAIPNRIVEIHAAKLLFPDHTYIEYPGNAAIAARSFDESWIDGSQSCTIYLGLKRASRHEANVTMVSALTNASAVQTRYACLENPPESTDLYSDGPAAQVLTLHHVVKIFFESELDKLADYDLIPAARLVRDGQDIKLSEAYIPPCYRLSGADTLVRGVRELRDELASRARQLEAYRSPLAIHKSDVDANHLAFFLALQALNRAAPDLFHLAESPHVHPWVVYGVLRRLVGELSAFSADVDMLGASGSTPALPAYDHLELKTCFTRARTVIAQLLSEITVGPEYLATLERRDDAYVGELPKTFFSHKNRYFLAIQSATEPGWLVDSLLRDARLAASDEIAGLISHALPGLELIHAATAPPGLPRRAHCHYFRIEQSDDLWQSVQRENAITLQWLDAPEDLKAEVVALRR
jgi:type VI secretion system protein ImpJ